MSPEKLKVKAVVFVFVQVCAASDSIARPIVHLERMEVQALVFGGFS
jgi:hypothetical protein